ncbi:phenylalanine--tRNA ligase subunit beta [Salsuginibacillus kocurii]|uniref:phenylalanine--tRNA ligase subunit beta n=1 Tax=Salsuginibacillus kocurii TaxID=427078 RepID=UPI000369484B|nr:phenylalanine--tRNA ligase subunit beta [Salsuginibacillus kocurii]
MLVSYNWLKEYIDVSDLSPEEVAEKLTRGGVEVDAIHRYQETINGLVVGEVVETKPHPEAEKLTVCQVDLGTENAQIVCGAQNVSEGSKVAVAIAGTELPNGMKIEATTLRGEESNGMICSLDELGVQEKLVPKEYAEGIVILPADSSVGDDALPILNLDDAILELDLTPNRADCLSMVGIAYEMAGLLDRSLQLPEVEHGAIRENAIDQVDVTIEAPEDNPYYGAKLIKNVQVKDSPLWLQNRLIAAGIRPINNVVDVTNFVLIEYGQPLHAFDFDTFGSNEVVVRRAEAEEEIRTLDEETRRLQNEHLVITNGKKPTAVAGVMGGADAEVTSETTTVLLEAAHFHPARVRKASKDLGLRSESSIRFEKGIDVTRVTEAAERAVALLEQIADGKPLAGTVEADHRMNSEVTINANVTTINNRLGTDLSLEEMTDIFRRLSIAVTSVNAEEFEVHVPARRPDLLIEEDISEEVARLYGYDQIPITLPEGTTTPGALTAKQQTKRNIRRFLEENGINEAITYSLTSETQADRFLHQTEKNETVRMALPMSEERSVLRKSLVPHLLEALVHNQNRQIEDVALYEMGSVFLSEEEQLTKQPHEKETLAAAITGLWRTHLWKGEKQSVDFFIVKGIVEGLAEELGLTVGLRFSQQAIDGLHPGRSARIEMKNQTVGIIGEVHPALQKEWDLKQTYVFQLDLETIMALDAEPLQYTPLPRFPSTSRDIAIVVENKVAAGEVEEIIKEAGGEILRHVQLFDVYEGEHMEEGKKSLAFSLTYLHPERTLTDEEVQDAHQAVLQALEVKVGAHLRQ